MSSDRLSIPTTSDRNTHKSLNKEDAIAKLQQTQLTSESQDHEKPKQYQT